MLETGVRVRERIHTYALHKLLECLCTYTLCVCELSNTRARAREVKQACMCDKVTK